MGSDIELGSEDMKRLYAEMMLKTSKMTIAEVFQFMETGILPDEYEEIEI